MHSRQQQREVLFEDVVYEEERTHEVVFGTETDKKIKQKQTIVTLSRELEELESNNTELQKEMVKNNGTYIKVMGEHNKIQ